jgi:hypothetical protein
MTSKNGYAAVALLTMKQPQVARDPRAAWDAAASELMSHSPSAERKGCPKSAFLGIAYKGEIKGIVGDPDKRIGKNADYALSALLSLRKEPSYASDPTALWRHEMQLREVEKQHNSQMHVVCALWNAGLLRRI